MSFKSILDYFHSTTGIEFKKNLEIVNRKIEHFYKDKGFNDSNEFFLQIKKDRSLYQELINLLTTSETYFYREFSQIKIFTNLLKEIDRDIKILCAPCASGEEPYSLFIAMLEAKIDIKKISLYAIDINSQEIEKAIDGTYHSRRLHQLSEDIKSKYFIEKQKHKYQIIPLLRDKINFQQLNIFEPFPNNFSNFDVIFSRNMLIYFDDQMQEKAEKIFYQKLRKGGHLFLGHADRIPHKTDLNRVMQKGISFYQKPL